MADSDYTGGAPRIVSEREMAEFEEARREFSQLAQTRSMFEIAWEEIASLILPSHAGTFVYGSYRSPGTKRTERQIDASGMVALNRFAAICDSLLTPRNQLWHSLGADDPYVAKQRGVKLYFEQVQTILFAQRYKPHANFSGQNQGVWQSLGAFGNGILMPDRYYSLDKKVKGLRYRWLPIGEVYLRQNWQGQVDGFIRMFRLTARQAMQQFGAQWFPEQLRPALEAQSEAPFMFMHRCCARTDDDYDPEHLGAKSLPFKSQYFSMDGKCAVAEESGYHTFPISASRYEQAPGETPGRGPAGMVLPSLKTLNAQKRVFLKQGHRAADPVLLTADDGIVGMSLRPGAMNKGGVNSQGKELVKVLPTGNIQINEKMMEAESTIIQDAFLVKLFQIMTESPQMTATEVIERINEKGILIAPTMSRQMSEYLGPLVEREIDLLAQMHLLPPMPPVLKEAGGQYSVTYSSPLTKMMEAGKASGFIRTVETVKELVAITGDRKLLSPFNWDVAIPAIADINGTPESWMNDQQTIAQLNGDIDKQLAQQQRVQAAPAAAAMMKAQAAQQAAVGQTPGAGQPTGG